MLTRKDPDAGKDWGQEEKEWYRMKWLDSITDTMDMLLNKLQVIVKDKEASHAWTEFSNWTRMTLMTDWSLFFMLPLYRRETWGTEKLIFPVITQFVVWQHVDIA